MELPYYRGDGSEERPERARSLPTPRTFPEPQNYLADPGLARAVNVAITLGQPLLLTGETGTGKTRLAYSLAWELGFGEPLRFDSKSTSTARDLLYVYDALGRLHAVQSGLSAPEPIEYISYSAMGKAILLANESRDVRRFMPKHFIHSGPSRSVVLIDEVDKAPRDFPNDLLSELEELSFRIPELGSDACVKAPPDMAPILVITSNSEKDLPDAFLRRAVYYDIPFPDRERLDMIIASRLGKFTGGNSKFLEDALDIFFELRRAGLLKPPSTAELLLWLVTLRRLGDDKKNPLSNPRIALETASCLIKKSNDQAVAERVIRQWAGQG